MTASENFVGVGRRAVAVIIDFFILFVLAFVIALLTGNTTDDGFQLSGAPALLSFLAWFGYFIAMEATNGATVGKMLVGAKVVKEDGSPMDWQAATIRNVLRIVDGLFVYLVGAILVWMSPKNQRLGDRVANTLVVDRTAATASFTDQTHA